LNYNKNVVLSKLRVLVVKLTKTKLKMVKINAMACYINSYKEYTLAIIRERS